MAASSSEVRAHQFRTCCTARLMSTPLPLRAILMRSPRAEIAPCAQQELSRNHSTYQVGREEWVAEAELGSPRAGQWVTRVDARVAVVSPYWGMCWFRFLVTSDWPF